jgi:hypothetical protein
MKPLLYAAVVFLLPPVQSLLLGSVGVIGAGPDLCLLAVCLAGFFAGEVDGILLGLAVGMVQDSLSAGDQWLNMATKGAAGLFAGLVGRHLAGATPGAMILPIAGMSLASCLVFMGASGVGKPLTDLLSSLRIATPELIFDTLLGVGAYWLLSQRLRLTAGREVR